MFPRHYWTPAPDVTIDGYWCTTCDYDSFTCKDTNAFVATPKKVIDTPVSTPGW